MKKIALLSLLVVPAILVASGHVDGETTRYFTQTGRESDFFPRIVNFTIFLGLLIYLVATPIKDFFKGRTAGIADKLNEIEAKLQLAEEIILKSEEKTVKNNTNGMNIWPEVVNNTT